MASSQAVYIKSGDQPRNFVFGNRTSPSSSVTATQASLPIYKESVYSTFQAVVTGTGVVTATVTFQVSNDDNTGRGFVFGNSNAPGTAIGTTSASNTITSPGNQFTQAIVGATVSAPGVPVGSTVSAVANAGSATISNNATATATIQADFFANNWCATVMGTITLSGTTTSTDGFTTMAPWRYVRANVTSITGTSATVSAAMGV